jgi:hypothetical protein
MQTKYRGPVTGQLRVAIHHNKINNSCMPMLCIAIKRHKKKDFWITVLQSTHGVVGFAISYSMWKKGIATLEELTNGK